MGFKEIQSFTSVEAQNLLITKIQGEFYKYREGYLKKLYSFQVMIEEDGALLLESWMYVPMDLIHPQ